MFVSLYCTKCLVYCLGIDDPKTETGIGLAHNITNLTDFEGSMNSYWTQWSKIMLCLASLLEVRHVPYGTVAGVFILHIIFFLVKMLKMLEVCCGSKNTVYL